MHQDTMHQHESLSTDPLRREAGEGWHEGGIDLELHALLVAREALLKASLALGDRYPSGVSTDLGRGYLILNDYTRELKNQRGIGEPPSRLDRSIDREA